MLYLLIVEAFTGYVLPWGQMSFWGATVITNLFSVIPVIGTYVIKFIWGGSIVNSLTLERFFMLHYLIPSIIIAFIIIHINTIHVIGSSSVNLYSIISDTNFVQLYPLFIIKDMYVFVLTFSIYFYLVCFKPYIFDNMVNNIFSDSKLTPKHIVPE